MNNLDNRKFIIIFIFIAVGLIYLIRLFYIQVLNDKWEKEARNIVQKMVSIHPSRGLIMDRNGELLVENMAVYDLMVKPRQINAQFDTTSFCELLGITKEKFIDKMNHAWGAHDGYISDYIFVTNKRFKKYSSYLDTLSGFRFWNSPRKPGYKSLKITGAKTNLKDTALLAKALDVSKSLLKKELKRAWRIPLNGYKGQVFEKLITAEDFDRINDKLYRFPGFYKQENTVRVYPDSIAGHVLGYIREIDAKRLENDTTNYYKKGDYLGITGVESKYEPELRGERGVSYYLEDVFQNKQGIAQEENNEIAIPGKTLFTSIDGKLQAYGELLMQNKTGSIVAIEPSSGEILAMVSSPNYDPNLLVGRNLGKNFYELLQDSLKPLNNRAVTAMYRPGSIFKLIQSLVALQHGYITVNTGFACNKALIGCHNHEPPVNVIKAIQHSCNPYYYNVYRRMIMQREHKSIFKDSEIGLIKWEKNIKKFGLGTRLPSDIYAVKSGQVPDTTFYNKWYGKGRWAFSFFRSNSIGEGELLVTPLQMANVAATIANRGYYYTPHLVRKIGKEGSKKDIFLEKNFVGIDTTHFTPVIEGMELVVKAGTARRAFISDSIIVCGKTGTIQDGNNRDHSAFIAFAPKDNPQIAIAVYVENAGFGGTWAAPIASLMMEKYLTGETKNKWKEDRILNAYIQKGKPIRNLTQPAYVAPVVVKPLVTDSTTQSTNGQ